MSKRPQVDHSQTNNQPNKEVNVPLSEQALDKLIVCPQCDVVAQAPATQEGQKLVCKRCGTVLIDRQKNSISKSCALALAGLILFFPAISFPLVGVGVVGQSNQASLLDSIVLLIDHNYFLIAASLFLFTIAMPILKLGSVFYITLAIKLNLVHSSMLSFFRTFHILDNWAMLNVYLLGTVVSMYKLISMASFTLGIGFIAYCLLLICSTMVTISLDHHLIWHELEQAVSKKLAKKSQAGVSHGN